MCSWERWRDSARSSSTRGAKERVETAYARDAREDPRGPLERRRHRRGESRGDRHALTSASRTAPRPRLAYAPEPRNQDSGDHIRTRCPRIHPFRRRPWLPKPAVMLPQWGQLMPFTMRASWQFRLPPPPALTNELSHAGLQRGEAAGRQAKRGADGGPGRDGSVLVRAAHRKAEPYRPHHRAKRGSTAGSTHASSAS